MNFIVDEDSDESTSEKDFHCLEDVMTLPQKLRNLRDGSLFLTEDPKAPDPKGKSKLLRDDSTEKDSSYSCIEDVMTIPRKLRNLRRGCLAFNDQPKKPNLEEGDKF